MILFKASGKTYRRVVTRALHAFPFSPAEVLAHELVLLSKNRQDCRNGEGQIQYLAKLLSVEPATAAELEQYFPGVNAGERWKYVARLYWSRPLEHAFSLFHVDGLNHRRYDTVQEFARVDAGDELLLLDFLCRSNPKTVLDFLSNAEPPYGSGQDGEVGQ